MSQNNNDGVAAAIEAGRELGRNEKEILLPAVQSMADGMKPFVILPSGRQVHSLEALLPKPKYFETRLVDVESFVDFVKTYKDNRTRIWMADGAMVAIINFHQPDGVEPDAEQHTQKAVLRLQQPKETQEWLQRMDKPLSQQDFAEFLEDHLGQIQTPDAATVLEVARTLEARRNVTFKSGLRLQNGDLSIQWVQETDARAGAKGDLEIPSELLLQLQLVEGGPTVPVKVGLRYRIDEGVLRFWLRALRLSEVLLEYERAIAKQVSEATGITVWRGTLCSW